MNDEGFPPGPTATPALEAPVPEWFQAAVTTPVESRRVRAGECAVHYLYWPETSAARGAINAAGGLLFLHGGGSHANWWRFIAPFMTGGRPAAAMDLSGMGDSGHRSVYSADLRAEEIQAVLDDAGFMTPGRAAPILVGHSFGGLTAMRYAALHGERLGGFVIAESPVRAPAAERVHLASRRDARPLRRAYESYGDAWRRFRLRPRQSCRNDYIVEFIARHSVRRVEGGWTWKFDPVALTRDRHREPFRDYLRAVGCRTAFVYGERSALCTPEVLAYTRTLLPAETPFVGIPEGQHHLILDEPLAFVSALRAVLAGWGA